ncbi:MAG: aminotransferase class I/II-fold pyridoxal phosphate-dependent enzyme [Chitinophagaceae bacterium]|nr:aminotransferase class I/II-fold pyridoxal phosphate-dependent enzyme [Chitinophagaceae bacterium]
MDLSYIINELGEDRESYFGAVAPPIIQTSNFAFKNVALLREAMMDEFGVNLYSRGNNPTVTILRKKLAALDHAEDALVLSSGVAAVFLAVFANVKQGDHIVSVAKPYSWTDKLFKNLLPRLGVTTTFVDGTRIENFEQAIQPNTKIIFLESPNSFTFELQDLEAVAQLAKSKQLLTIIDNSYCSPLYQRPIDFGIDISIQTATKYLGGHSDVIAGVIAGKKEMIEKIFRSDLLTVGSVISPFNAWLLIRSLRTLEIRLERIAQSTLKIAAWMENLPPIEKIHYPFSPSFPQYDLAKKQMQQAPGLFTVVLKANSIQAIEKFCNTLKHFLMAVSWGGHESLIFPSCAVIKPEDFNPDNVTHRMVRFYIGLEDAGYLMEDIAGALGEI